MPLLENLLLRFRRVWAPPGPVAGQAGVPADLDARIENELEDLSAQLAALQAEADVVVRDAQLQADAFVSAARVMAEQEVAAMRVKLPEIRAKSALSRASSREADMVALTERAAREASTVRDRARARMRPLVEAAVERIYAGVPEQAKEDHADAVGGR